jgi:hypothetical protein
MLLGHFGFLTIPSSLFKMFVDFYVNDKKVAIVYKAEQNKIVLL